MLFTLNTGFGSNLKPDAVHIVWDNERPSKKEQRKWEKGCKKLGNFLTIGKGIYKSGSFTNFSCYIDAQGYDQVETNSAWKLRLTIEKSGISLELNHVTLEEPVATVTLPYHIGFLSQLGQNEFSALLAASIVNQMPYSWVFDGSTFDENSINLNDEIIFKRLRKPKLSKRLILYDLFLEQQTWRSSILGYLVKESGEKYRSKTDLSLNKTIYSHSTSGPGKWAIKIENYLRKYLNRLDSSQYIAKSKKNGGIKKGSGGDGMSLLDPRRYMPGGFVGLKYGLQVHPGESVQSQTQYIGLLLELRGGFLEGLRYYYDKVPEETKNETLTDGTTVETKIAFAKHVLGYSFSLDIASFLPIFTIDPKLGIWTLDSTLPSSYDSEGTVEATSEFNLGTTISAALEIGAEIYWKHCTLRGFVAQDVGYSPIKSGASITSLRLGSDFYFPISSNFAGIFKMKGILFYLNDSVTITQTSDSGGEDKVLNYSIGFAGLGVALSW